MITMDDIFGKSVSKKAKRKYINTCFTLKKIECAICLKHKSYLDLKFNKVLDFMKQEGYGE